MLKSDAQKSVLFVQLLNKPLISTHPSSSLLDKLGSSLVITKKCQQQIMIATVTYTKVKREENIHVKTM